MTTLNLNDLIKIIKDPDNIKVEIFTDDETLFEGLVKNIPDEILNQQWTVDNIRRDKSSRVPHWLRPYLIEVY